MTPRVAAVVPVKDGARYLAEVLAALAREAVDEVLVIDSGSRDGSVEIARARGRRACWRSRRPSSGTAARATCGAERTSAEIVAFLTQDATPVPGWRAALLRGVRARPAVGAVFGPHLPRPDTSPMIARELTEFFATFAADGDAPRVFGAGDPTFLSNVNAAYRRACWEEIRFDDVPYSEDQAFGRALAAHPRWRKAYAPRAGGAARARLPAGRVHAPLLRRVPRPARDDRARRADRRCARRCATSAGSSRATGAGCASRACAAATVDALDRRARWCTTAAARCSRRSAAAAQPPAARRVQRALSLEGRADGAAPRASPRRRRRDLPATAHQPRAARGARLRGDRARAARRARRRCSTRCPGMADRERLHVAFAIPPFSIGSGGHNIIFQLVLRLERMGHTCSIWLHDPFNQHARRRAGASCAATIVEHFAPVQAPVFRGFGDWYGADVAVATRLADRVPAARAARRARARVPRSTTTSPSSTRPRSSRSGPTETYRQGLYGIAGSPWLRDLYVERYGGAAGTFQYGVDHDVYFPRPVERRRDDTIVFYARAVTPRRAVALGVMALAELQGAPPGRAHRAVRRPRAARTPRSRTSTSASRRPSSSPGCTPRRRSASACR